MRYYIYIIKKYLIKDKKQYKYNILIIINS